MVFCDLGGSTRFGEHVDPELARTVMARYHATLQSVIDAHGGRVAKFMGDGMMALFGIPDIAEDDARRAVLAGIEAQRRFEAFAADVMARHGETLTLRVGINTGEVVIATGDADLVGDALNVAARLEKACRPGQVLVGEETWRLTRGEFGYEALGETTVAGRAGPVATFEVVSATQGPMEISAPFVGREIEMRRLRSVFDSSRLTRTANLVTVLGSPGLGKTRLSREFTSAVAVDADASTFEVRCDRAGASTFAPITALIREAAGLDDREDPTDPTDPATEPERIRRALAGLLQDDADRDRLAEILAGLFGAAPTRSVEETFWAIRRLIESTAAVRPMVVVIDDIQWAEPLLLDLLEHLTEWVRGVPLLLLCLARPELREVRPALTETGRRVADVLVLDGLDARATEALAAGLLGAERLPAGLVAHLPTSTDGNPLFVRELVRMLVDDHVIRRRDGEWELAIDADAVEVPPTIASLLAARIERLPADARELLELASVIGAEFSLGALRDLARNRPDLGALLEGMRRKELVEPTGAYWGDEAVYRFHHVLIRDASYRRLLKTTRADLHERVAVWTDGAAVELAGEHEASVAYHYEQAYLYRQELGDVDGHAADLGRRASTLLATAANRAMGRDDVAAAGALARRALALLPASDAAGRAALLLVACECFLSSGDVVNGRLLVAQLVATATGDGRLQAWAACFNAQLVGLTDPEGLSGAEAEATAAAQALEELGDGAGEAKAHQVRAMVLARLGRVGDAELELDLAVRAARAVEDRRRVTAVLGAAPGAALWGPSPVARAGGRCLDVVRLLRITTASPSVEATSMRCQAVLEALRGRFDVARSMLATARATLEELGLRHGLLETDLLAGVVELIADDWPAAIAPLRTAYRGLDAMGVGPDAGQAAALLSRALVASGQIDEADKLADAAEALAGQNLKTAVAWRIARAEVLAARGLPHDGVAIAEAAVEIAAATDLLIDHADACVALAGLRAGVGDAVGARAARSDAIRLYELKGAVVPAQRLAEEALHDVGPAAGVGGRGADPQAWPSARERSDFGAEPPMAGATATEAPGPSDTQAPSASTALTAPTRRAPDPVGAMGTAGGSASASPAAQGGPEAAPATRDVEPDPTATPPLENAATRMRDRLLTKVRAGDLALEDEVADDARRLGRRRIVSATDTFTRADMVENLRNILDAFDLRFTTIAVRGERLVLSQVAGDANGFRSDWISLLEIGEDGRVKRTMSFDADNLAAALDELEDRYCAGEGTKHEFLVRRVGDELRSLQRRDWAAATELFAPSFRFADRRRMGYPTVDRTAMVEMWRLDVEGAPDRAVVPATLEVRGDAVLVRCEETGTSPTGSALARSWFLVWHGAQGRWIQREAFEVDDHAAARARLDELGRETRAPIADNDVVRLVERRRWRMEHEDRSSRATVFGEGVSEDVVSFDRRAGVSMPTVTGRAAYVAYGLASYELFATMVVDPVAVRGNRLALSRARFQIARGDEMAGLVLYETDEAGLLCKTVVFDESDLVAALDELEARHEAIAGRAYRPADRWVAKFTSACNHRDWDAFAAAFSNDFRVEDHRRLGFPQRDGAALLAATRVRVEQAPDVVVVVAQACSLDDVFMLAHRWEGSTPEGSRYEWHYRGVGRLSPEGLITQMELFGEDQWAEALALFDEWSDRRRPPSTAPAVANTAASAADRVVRMIAAGEDVSEVTTDDVVRIGRRRIVSAPETRSREGFVNAVRSIVEGCEMTQIPIAIRGDRLTLNRMEGRANIDFTTVWLTLWECDAAGRIRYAVSFDETDLAAALDELEDRYCAGEGADHAQIVRLHGDYFRALARRDWDGLEALLAPDFAAIDHRRIGFGSGDGAWMVELQKVIVETVPDMARFAPLLDVHGDVTFTLMDSRGTSVGGDPLSWPQIVVMLSVAGRVQRYESFEMDELVAARTRIDELLAEPRTTHIDNDAVRWAARHFWLLTHSVRGDPMALDEHVAKHVADDFVLLDRRAGASLPEVRGRAVLAELLLAGFDAFEKTSCEPMAVRGERLVLARRRLANAGGHELTGINIYETDADGRASRLVLFDETDLGAAVDELEERHRLLSGDSYRPSDRVFAAFQSAFNHRDWDAAAAVCAPGFGTDDHRRLGSPRRDVGAFVRAHQIRVEQTPNAVIYAEKTYTHDGIVVGPFRYEGSTPASSGYEWAMVLLARVSPEGLFIGIEAYDEDQWVEALARFDELRGETEPVPGPVSESESASEGVATARP